MRAQQSHSSAQEEAADARIQLLVAGEEPRLRTLVVRVGRLVYDGVVLVVDLLELDVARGRLLGRRERCKT